MGSGEGGDNVVAVFFFFFFFRPKVVCNTKVRESPVRKIYFRVQYSRGASYFSLSCKKSQNAFC